METIKRIRRKKFPVARGQRAAMKKRKTCKKEAKLP